MKLKEVKISIKGDCKLRDFEIEGQNVMEDWVNYTNVNGGYIKKEDFDTDDDELDFLIKLGGPNGTEVSLKITGQDGDENKLNYTEDYKITSNGRLEIKESLKIEDLISS